MATLSDFNGQASFTIGGNSFNNRASSGTPIYERTGGGGGSVGAEVKAILHATRAPRFQEGDLFVTGPRAFNSTFVEIMANRSGFNYANLGQWGLKFDFITPIENPIVQATTAGVGIYSNSSGAVSSYSGADIQIQEILVSNTSVTIGIRDKNQGTGALYMPYLEWSAVVY